MKLPLILKGLVFALIVTLCVLCKGGGERVRVIKASLSQNPQEPQVRAVELFKKIVEEKSEGKLKVEIYPNNQLGNQRDVVEGIQLGTIQMSNIASVLAGFVPELNIFELPFLFENKDHFYAVLDSKIGDSLEPAFEKRGFHLLGYFDAGVRHVMTVDEPVRSIGDLKGLKIRTMENPLHLAAFKAFGANPMPMAYGELYTALEQHVIDGAEAANTNYLSKKFYEPAPQWAMVGWIHLIETVIMSWYFYDRLPLEHQKIIDEAALEMIQKERQWYSESEDEALLQLVEEGVKVTRPNRRPFVKASQKVYKEWAERVGGMDLIERIIRFDYSQNDYSAKETGISPAQLSILWAKDQDGITAPLIGPRSVKQIEELLPVLEMRLDAEVREACDGLVPPGSVAADFFNSAEWMKMKIL